MTVVINGTTGIDTGTGSLIAADSTTPTYLDLFEDTDNGSNYVRLIAPTSVASNRTITLPDGTGTVAVNGVSGVLVSGTSQTAPFASPNTSCDFTGIPSWVKRITVMLSGVSLSGTANNVLQVGSGSFAVTGYNSSAVSVSTATAATTNGTGASNVTDYIHLGGYASTAASLAYGQVIVTNITGNTWVASSTLYIDGADRIATSAGNVVLGGTLDRVRITTTNGTDTFDAGTINIIYE